MSLQNYLLFICMISLNFKLSVCQSERLRGVDIERNIFELEKLLVKEWDYDLKKTGVCHQLLSEFSAASSQFMLCANAHAKPISMCRACFHEYNNVTQTYKSLGTHFEQDSDRSCMQLLTSQDRLEVVQETYKFIAAKREETGLINNKAQGLWSKGNCESCYSTPFAPDSVLSAITEDFFVRKEKVDNCFKQFPYQEGAPRNSSKVCQVCRPFYQNLSEFYIEHILEKQAPFICQVCIDIVDAMNITQREWGEKYNCGRKLEHHYPLLVLVVIVLCTPLVFYSLVRLAESSAAERVISQRNITNFLDSNLRRLSFNRRSRFSRSSRQVSRDQQPRDLQQVAVSGDHQTATSASQGLLQTDQQNHQYHHLTVPSSRDH